MVYSSFSARLGRVPMLRLLLFFGAGIVAAEWFALPLWFLTGAFLVAGLVALLGRSGTAVAVMLVVAGFADARLHRTEPDVPQNLPALFEVEVEGLPVDRGRYLKADARVAAWREAEGAVWYPASSRIVLYADSLEGIEAGKRICCRGVIRPFVGSPGFGERMVRLGYAGRLWLAKGATVGSSPLARGALHRCAVERLSALDLPPRQAALVEAMAAGERRALTPQMRSLFSRSGFSHLLAVSGLHAGLVFVLINLLLGWLPLLRWGHLLKNVATVAALWLFVAAAGFPVSAVRAAVMCSLLQLALASASEYVALNALGAAALGMLMWNPAWIADAGFQLSFVAVAAILVWGVPLCRICRVPWRGLRVVVELYLVGLAASLATAPLISHLFGVVPLAGLLANPLVIGLAGGVVLGGVVWMLFPVTWLAAPVGAVAGGAAEMIWQLASCVATLPCGVWEYELDGRSTAVVYLLFVVVTLLWWRVEPKKNVPLQM